MNETFEPRSFSFILIMVNILENDRCLVLVTSLTQSHWNKVSNFYILNFNTTSFV